MRIGLIGGIGPAATDYYYRRLIALSAQSGDQLDLMMAHADVGTLGANAAAGDAAPQAAIFLALIARLHAAGCDLVAVTSVTGHFCIREVEAASPIPVINAVAAIDEAVARSAPGTVGLLGTRIVMQSGVYGALLAARVLLPQDNRFDEVHEAYLGMATSGQATQSQRDVLFRAGSELVERGARLVILGGTDMFLAFSGHDCGYPTLDCADIHAEAIYRAATTT